jgi:hypothetical protein
VFRDKSTVLSKVVPSLFFALVIGAIYSDVGNGQKAIQDLVGALFFFTINQTFGNMFAVLQTFSEEKVKRKEWNLKKKHKCICVNHIHFSSSFFFFFEYN